MVLEKVPWFEIFSLILAENPLFFPDWKVLKIFPDFPDRWEPWSVHTVTQRTNLIVTWATRISSLAAWSDYQGFFLIIDWTATPSQWPQANDPELMALWQQTTILN